MSLSNDIISQFVKIANNKQKTQKKETITYGVVSEIDNEQAFVVLDGTATNQNGTKNAVPASMTVNAKTGDRVIVMIKNHSAVITGNLGNPATNQEYVDATTGKVKEVADEAKSKTDELGNKVVEFELALGKKLDVDEFTAEIAAIENLQTDSLLSQTVNANKANVAELTAKNAEIEGVLEAVNANIENLTSDKASVGDLEAANAEIDELKSSHAEFEEAIADRIDSAEANIGELNTKKLDVETATITYANIDFSNITKAAMEYFYANSGLIENVVVGNGSITGVLVGVTIKGDIIEGGTIVADKLVIQGEDGLYYKLNTNGVTTEAEQTEYNSLNGSVITAKTITATQISVNDLVAFDATIGGFNITENSIYSEVKDSEGNTTRGIYMDTDGQINFGDSNNFIKYYKAEDGTYKLVISASDILYALDGKQHSLSDIGSIGEYVRVGTHEGEPCIELGEADSDFKLVITNTRILFMEGTAVPAYINNQSLHITKAVIEEEIQQGEFVWKVRANGNMGLVWKGDV